MTTEETTSEKSVKVREKGLENWDLTGFQVKNEAIRMKELLE